MLERPAVTIDHRTVALKHGPDTSPLDPATDQEFEASLAAELAPALAVVPETEADLTIQYRFVHYDSGNAVVRVGSGLAGLFGSPFYGLGDGAVGVEATFLDHQGTVMARVVVEGQIAGFFGSTDSGLESAAEAVAQFAQRHFHVPPPEVDDAPSAEQPLASSAAADNPPLP